MAEEIKKPKKPIDPNSSLGKLLVMHLQVRLKLRRKAFQLRGFQATFR